MSIRSNASEVVLHGYLDSTHTSNLTAYWINRPTPWPFVLASVGLSIILGFMGVQSSYKSWESDSPRFNSESTIALTPNTGPKAYMPLLPGHHRRWSSANSSTYTQIIENDAMEAYYADRRPSSTYLRRLSASSMHGGLGRFALFTTALGISWSTIRAGALLAILIRITQGERHTYPGIISVVIMFTSVQPYLGSRAMPRILYLLVVADLLAIYTGIVLATLSFFRAHRTSYQQFGVRGGNCPCMLGFRTADDMRSCASFAAHPPAQIGCDASFLWSNNTDSSTNATMTYPKSCLLSGDHDKDLDPNLMTYMVLAEMIVGGVGLLYGLVVLAVAVRWIPRALRHPSRLFEAFALTDDHHGPTTTIYPSSSPVAPGRQKMPSRAIGMTVLAFIALLIFAAVTIIVHVLDETRPIRLFYMDSAGPLVVASSTAAPSSTGGSWSDCFVVDTPYWADGGFALWWSFRQSRLMRALALA